MLTPAAGNTETPGPDAYSIAGFCAAHSISRASFYNLLKAGAAPRIMRVGARVLISREAAAAWRAQREALEAIGR
jgi:hypothetical protein